jgi:hypothetical protein
MSPITIPESLKGALGGSAPTTVCDEQGNTLGYYMPRREATPEDYAWALQNVTQEELDYSLESGPARPFAEVIAELRKRFGP